MKELQGQKSFINKNYDQCEEVKRFHCTELQKLKTVLINTQMEEINIGEYVQVKEDSKISEKGDKGVIKVVRRDKFGKFETLHSAAFGNTQTASFTAIATNKGSFGTT